MATKVRGTREGRMDEDSKGEGVGEGLEGEGDR